ncbi:RHS repeat-associated core domain-containing protein [Cysteiniphilum halobium]|uniref:RHS repeat-associated core domain-containing protein n=1 Tax=Cysteiniphilum halobium TaxID=2219059 RepID=UPI003F86BC90
MKFNKAFQLVISIISILSMLLASFSYALPKTHSHRKTVHTTKLLGDSESPRLHPSTNFSDDLPNTIEVSKTNLSALYRVPLITSNMHPNLVFNRNNLFTLTATYNNNNSSNFWGIGTGWSLNIPYLKFSSDWFKTCRGTFDKKGDCKYDKTAKLIRKSVEDFPKRIIFNSGSGSIAFKTDDDVKKDNPITYIPSLKSSMNYTMEIIATKKTAFIPFDHTVGYTFYTFEIKYLNDKNKKIIFTFNKEDNNRRFVAIHSTIYQNPKSYVEINYAENSDDTGLTITGMTNSGEDNSIKLTNIYPSYDMKNSIITPDKDVSQIKDVACVTNGDFAHVDWWSTGGSDKHGSGTSDKYKAQALFPNKWELVPHDYTAIDHGDTFIKPMPTVAPHCPKKKDYISTGDTYNENNVTENLTLKGTNAKNATPLIKGKNLENQNITLVFHLDNYNLIVHNILSYTGTTVNAFNGEGEASSGDREPVVAGTENYFSYAMLGFSGGYTIQGKESTLYGITKVLDRDNVPIENISVTAFTYSSDYQDPHVNQSGWAIPVNYLSPVELSLFGLSYITPVPLLSKITIGSIFNQTKETDISYSQAFSNVSYSNSTVLSQTEDNFLDEALSNITLPDMNSSMHAAFAYVSSVTTGDETTNYSWETFSNDEGKTHNIYKMTNDPVEVGNLNDDIENVIAESSIYSISGLTSSDDLKNARYGVVTDNGKTKEISTYNCYGLLTESSTCNENEDDCQNTKITYYNPKIDSREADLDKFSGVYNQVSKIDFYHNNDLISTIGAHFDDQNRPDYIINCDGDNHLLNADIISYTNPDSDAYFNIDTIKSLGAPFNSNSCSDFNADKIKSNNTVSKTYHYTSNSVDNTYEDLDSIVMNLNDLKYSTISYKYDDYLRPIKQRVCVSKSGDSSVPSCDVNATSQDRYSTLTQYTYRDNTNDKIPYQSIETDSSRIGNSSIINYEPGTDLIDSMISANGEKASFKYDDYGRILNKVIEQNWYNNQSYKLSDTTYKYTYPNTNYSNEATVQVTDMYGNSSLSAYDEMGRIILHLGADLNTQDSPGLDENSKTTYAYNSQNHLSTITKYFGAKELSKDQFTYDYQGRVLSNTNTVHKTSKDVTYKKDYTYKYSFSNSGKYLSVPSSKSVPYSETDITQSISGMPIGKSVSRHDLYLNDSNDSITDIFYTYTPNKDSSGYETDSASTSKNVITYNEYKDNLTDSDIVHTVTLSSTASPTTKLSYNALGLLGTRDIGDTSSSDKTDYETINYNYDSFGRLISYKLNGNEEPYSLHYNDEGSIDTETYTVNDSKKTARTTKYNYQPVCLVSSTYCTRENLGWNNSQLQSIVTSFDPQGDYNGVTTTYTYSSNGDPSIDVSTNQGGNSVETKTSYDDTLKVHEIDETSNINNIKNTSSLVYNYDSKGILNNRIISQNGATEKQSYNYKEDTTGNSIILTKNDSLTTSDLGNYTVKTVNTMDPFENTVSSSITSSKEGIVPYHHNYNMSYTYDDESRLTDRTISNSDKTNDFNETAKYSYYDQNSDNYNPLSYNQLKQSSISFGNGNANTGKVTIDYQYDQLTGKLNNRMTSVDQNGSTYSTTDTYQYDSSLQRLKTYTCDSNPKHSAINCPSDILSDGNPITSRTYKYDDNNNIATITTNSNNNIAKFNYDNNTNQLQSVVLNEKSIYQFKYNDGFNRVTSITDTIPHSYTYTPDGLIHSIGVTAGQGGKVTLSRGIDGQISSIEYPGLFGNTNTIKYYGGNFYSSDRTTSRTQNGVHNVLGSLNSPDLDLEYFKHSNDGSDTYHAQEYIKGVNGRVIAQLDQNAWTLKALTYTPYGHMTTNPLYRGHADPGPINELLQHGENGQLTLRGDYSQNSAQYQFLGSRVYMPGIMRFIQHDTASPYGGGGANGFMYGAGDPVEFTDPSGHWGDLFQVGFNNAYGAHLSPEFQAVIDENRGSLIAITIISGVFALAGGVAAAAELPVAISEIVQAGLSVGRVASVVTAGAGVIGGVSGVVASGLTLGGIIENNPTLEKIGGGFGIASIGADIISGMAGIAAAGIMRRASGSYDLVAASEANAEMTGILGTYRKIGAKCFTGDTKVLVSSKDYKNQSISKKLKSIDKIRLGNYTVVKSKKHNNYNSPKKAGDFSSLNTTTLSITQYEKEPITPSTWQQVTLTYMSTINGHSYPDEIKLLYPIEWFKSHNINQVGQKIHISVPEFGPDAIDAEVTDIKPTTLNTSHIDWSIQNSRPVIGVFKRYAPIVNQYRFKDIRSGKITTINATPNHPFYVKNKEKFVPIEFINSHDILINEQGDSIQLVCDDAKRGCGERVNKDGKPVEVYNLEVYRAHYYYAGKSSIKVHNAPCTVTLDASQGEWYVRVDGKLTMDTISASDSESSMRAFNMEDGGARHLFSASDGITYPHKDVMNLEKTYYHFYSNDLLNNYYNKVLGRGLEAPEIVAAEMPEGASNIAARGEYRVNSGQLTNSHVLTYSADMADAAIHDSGLLRASIDDHDLVIDFSGIRNSLRASADYTPIPMDQNTYRYLKPYRSR